MRLSKARPATARLLVKLTLALAEANATLDIGYRNDRNSWDAFVAKINDELNPLDLEFAHLYDEISGKEMYAVVCLNPLCPRCVCLIVLPHVNVLGKPQRR